jgi:hypothetical protein
MELFAALYETHDPRSVLDYLRAFPNLAASLSEP